MLFSYVRKSFICRFNLLFSYVGAILHKVIHWEVCHYHLSGLRLVLLWICDENLLEGFQRNAIY